MGRKEERNQLEKKLLAVRVRPGAQRAGVEKLGSGGYLVNVVSPPEGGKANREVIARLAEYFGVPASKLRIVRGEKSRLKLVAIDSPLRQGRERRGHGCL